MTTISKHKEICRWCMRPAQIHGLCKECCPCCEPSELDKIKEIIQSMPTKFPEKESDDYDSGYAQAIQDVLEKLEIKNEKI